MGKTFADSNKPHYYNGAVIAYCNRMRERDNWTLRYHNGEITYIQGDVSLTPKEYRELLPVGLIEKSNGKGETITQRQSRI